MPRPALLRGSLAMETPEQGVFAFGASVMGFASQAVLAPGP
jgi:hypothetical protein